MPIEDAYSSGHPNMSQLKINICFSVETNLQKLDLLPDFPFGTSHVTLTKRRSGLSDGPDPNLL